jgi:hypothetical protein
MVADRGLQPIRMGQLEEGDILVRFRPPVGDLRVTGRVKGPNGHLVIQYLKDGAPDEYRTWASTHAFRRA